MEEERLEQERLEAARLEREARERFEEEERMADCAVMERVGTGSDAIR